MSMRKVPLKVFLEELTWVCEQAKFHGFYVQCQLSPKVAQIDVTIPAAISMKPSCHGKRHEFIFKVAK